LLGEDKLVDKLKHGGHALADLSGLKGGALRRLGLLKRVGLVIGVKGKRLVAGFQRLGGFYVIESISQDHLSERVIFFIIILSEYSFAKG
jgi:hypothetical protein